MKTKFHADEDTLTSIDPFDGTELERRIVITPIREEESDLDARSLAVVFWASYFAMHWLLLLEVIEPTWQRFGATLFFFLIAVLLSIHVAAHGAGEKK
jgi:hypothetical protein